MSEPRSEGGVVRRLGHLAATLVFREIDVHVPHEISSAGPTLAVANPSVGWPTVSS